MGQQVSLPLAQAGPTGINVRELADLSYEKSLGTARFMKSIRTRHKHGVVVVRLFGRPHENFDFKPYVQSIKRERELLAGVANALPYVRIVETPHAGYLCRQYLASSLYDRISTRPFLDDIEKKWLAFQLLTAVRDCHKCNVYHGDIKTENVLVTSWNWLYLADFSSAIKPTYLPEDDPADYSYYFDTSGRRTCYLAPERFLRPGQRADEQGVTWAMDVFSAGCVIAELFLETPFFTLSTSIKYRDGDTTSVDAALKRIEDPDIRELVAHMTQIEPESRYSAEEYLNFWRRKAFPEYFYSFLHQYLDLLTDPSSGTSPIDPETTNFGDADHRIQRVFLDFEKISYFLDSADDDALPADDTSAEQASTSDVLPVQLDIPNQRHPARRRKLKRGPDDGSLIFLTLVVASLRNSARATARVQACDVLLAFAERLSDTAKLDRILPFLVVLLNDKSDDVKIAAVRSVIQLLDLVEMASPVNAFVFAEYIKPRLQNMIYEAKDPVGPAVRATYASCLASLARSSARILDMTQSVRSGGPTANVDPDTEDAVSVGDSQQRALYDSARADLVDHFASHTKALLTDPDASVRRAFLGSVSSLCVFFGPTRAADVVVSHLNTYLNDKDWMLKCAFFRTIVGVAAYIGSTSFEDFILPLMLQALTDPEELVVERVISSFASMAELGLFQKSRLFEMVDIVARFTMHPNQWIRDAAVHFISASQNHITVADMHGIVLQLIKPYLKINVTDLSALILLDALKKPLSRGVYDAAANWSLRVGKGIFWRNQKDQHTFSFRGNENTVTAISSKDLTSKSLQRIPKNQEDEQWLNRLGNLGMNATEDGFKLLALREYIARTAKRRDERQPNTNAQTLNIEIGLLATLDVLPETVAFEKQTRVIPDERETAEDNEAGGTRKRSHTITDALLDASQSLGDEVSSPIERSSEAGTRPRLEIPRRASAQHASSDGISSPSTAAGSPGGQSLRPGLAVVDAEGRRHSTTALPDSAKARPDLDRVRGLKHRSSAMSLLGKKAGSAGSYGSAQISTSATHAEGEMDGPFHAEGAPDDASSSTKVDDGKPKGPRREEYVGHTYRGTDPNVSKLLDNLAAHSALYDDAEFGPHVSNKTRRHGSKQPGQHADGPYRPNGVLVATITEQNGAINRLLAAPDHNFFLSASDDGTVAIFDRQRFEKSLVHRPRLIYRHGEGTEVVALAFVQNTHTFVSCATDGSVHVVKVECSWVGKTLRIGSLTVKRSYQLRRGEHAVWCEHYKAKAASQSVLILVTNLGRIVSLDLRSLNTLYTIEVSPIYGIPTTACLGSKKTWILIGTSTGILALYDLRFHLLMRVWGFRSVCQINSIELYERPQYRDTTTNVEHQIPLHDDRTDRNVIVAGGTGTNDVSIWDIEKCACVEVYRVGMDDGAPRPERTSKKASMPPNLATSKAAHRALDPVQVGDMKPDELLARLNETDALDSGVDRSPRSLCVGSLVPYHQPHSQAALGSEGNSRDRERQQGATSFVITAGSDRRTRFWSCSALDASAVVSGLAADELQPTYRSVQSALSPGLVMHVEVPDPRSEEARDNERRRLGRTLVMQREQSGLLRKHLDVITAVMVLEGNEGRYIVSGDRKGTILVFR